MKHNFVHMSILKRAVALSFCLAIGVFNSVIAQQNIELWGMIELTFSHKPIVNAYVENTIDAVFSNNNEDITIRGFYAGNGLYKVRFMPSELGEWSYRTVSNVGELAGITGIFICVPPSGQNHGQVKVHNKYHFAYTDGTPYYPFGTTCYSFIYQSDSLFEATVNELANSPFNKIRFCVFPQWQDFSDIMLSNFPFRKNEQLSNSDTIIWNLSEFNPVFFDRLDWQLETLAQKGIEADLILFHPYDENHWGFDRLNGETELFYLKYLIARLGAYRNVWWSLANEYDFMRSKSLADWEAILTAIIHNDNYGHLCSVHNGKKYFSNWDKRLTHASIQNGELVEDFGRAVILRDVYHKPVIYDEIGCEGDLEYRWGNLSAMDITSRFWHGLISGTYVGYGETYAGNDSILNLVVGGSFKGESVPRIQFLKNIVESSGAFELIDHFWGVDNMAISEKGNILIYFGKEINKEWAFSIPREAQLVPGTTYKAELIDTWNMEKTILPESYTVKKAEHYYFGEENNKVIHLPEKPFMAILLVPNK